MSKFVMSNEDWTTLMQYAKYAYDEHKSEIGGYMVVKYVDKQFVFSEPVILQQEITASNTDITTEALGKYFTETEIKYGGEPYWLCWWHSHHTMDVFWSGTDKTAIEQSVNDNYAFSLVINLKQEQILRISDWKTGTQTDTKVKILGKEFEIPQSIKDEVESLCTKPSLVSTNTGWYGRHYSKKISKEQLTMWQDELDDEKVNLEADIDNILQDYLIDNDYPTARKRFGTLNRKLGQSKSELRVIKLEQDELDTVINYALAEQYIYAKGTEPDIAEIVADASFERSFK